MRAVLLAGGYATRLYPLTKDRPKALLPVGGKSILDHNIDALESNACIEAFDLVTNERFVAAFRRWAAARPPGAKPVGIFSDGTDSNENRLGAVGDLKFVIDAAGIDRSEHLYVAGTDNMADFDIARIIDLAEDRSACAVFAYRPAGREQLKRKGVVVLDDEGRVLRFVEKSDNPPGDLVVPPYYVFSPQALSALDVYLREGNNPDAPGHFMAWLVQRVPVYAIVTERRVLDIGTLDAYQSVLEQLEEEGDERG